MIAFYTRDSTDRTERRNDTDTDGEKENGQLGTMGSRFVNGYRIHISITGPTMSQGRRCNPLSSMTLSEV